MNRKYAAIFGFLTFSAPISWAQHTITTVAGGGPNNLPALQAGIYAPQSVFKDSLGNLYVAAINANAIYKIDTAGTLTRVAGNGTSGGSSGDGGPASSAELFEPSGVFVDRVGEAQLGRAKASDPANCETDQAKLADQYLKESDRAFSKHDWLRAKSLYELVLTNPAASPFDRSLAKTRVESADKQLKVERLRKEEETIWDQAVAAKAAAGQDRSKLEAAQSLFRQVSTYGLTHKIQADQEIANINAMIAGIGKGEQEKECGQKWISLSTEYNTYVEKREENKLNSLQGSLDQFSRTLCPQADQARTLSNRIPGIIAGWNPTPLAPKVESEKTRSDPENNAIHNLIEVQLTAAFHEKDVRQVLVLWPSPHFAKENLDLRVIRQNGRWIIKNITW
jgi:hypothetical protein